MSTEQLYRCSPKEPSFSTRLKPAHRMWKIAAAGSSAAIAKVLWQKSGEAADVVT